MKTIVSTLIALCTMLGLQAENGHQLWLRPRTPRPVKVICNLHSPTIDIALRELQQGWQGKTNAVITLSLSKDKAIKADGFKLEAGNIEARTASGILYGVYELLRRQITGEPIHEAISNPSYERRILDHWDNPDGSIEHGYGGLSIFWRKNDPFVVTDSDRMLWQEYARADASIGINGAVLNNVNASVLMLSADYLERAKAIADALRPYGVRTYLSVRFSSPVQIDKLKTADPLDPAVIAWWQNKIKEIYRLIPDFGGFLVKATSEGQPGPQDYVRTHADGANMLADIVKPYGNIIMWRAFVYNASGKDRATQAYTEFTPLDGKFHDNVIIQVKNGPVDFQPREPFSPLFGAMKKTAIAPEFQVTQEYLGQAIHLVFLAPTWEECLQSDTYEEGAGSTVARCTDGSLYPQQHTAIAGVANIGLDPGPAKPNPAAPWPVHADNGDGTFTNPVIMADFPDVDVIRVKDTYYMLATTMFTFPGVPLLQSHDLVNWSYCTNIVKRMDAGPCYNLDSCNRYGHGQWAGSLRFHNGLFYVLFNTLNEGAFLCTATDPTGEWKIKRLGRGFHDCGLLFDDNGKIYVASGYNKIYMTELDPAFNPITKDSLIFTADLRPGLEGTHIYQLNGYYYLYCTYGGGAGFQVALRSKNIWGPYEEKIVIKETDRSNVNFGIHQGALIQTQAGEWWTMLFIDMGPFGRFPSLQPVTWEDGWPVAGVDGKAITRYKKPDVGAAYPISNLPTSDEFNAPTLGMQWSWNHNPDPAKWSLTARPGWLQLSAGKPVSDLMWARNTLTQRPIAKYDQSIPTIATTCIDVTHMKAGDIAGLCVFQDPYAYIAIRQDADARYLVMVNNGITIDSIPVRQSTIYLRAKASNVSKKAVFEYGFDLKTFTPLGNELAMRFNLKIFTGNKFCLFNYATKETGGYVDFDWFHMD